MYELHCNIIINYCLSKINGFATAKIATCNLHAIKSKRWHSICSIEPVNDPLQTLRALLVCIIILCC